LLQAELPSAELFRERLRAIIAPHLPPIAPEGAPLVPRLDGVIVAWESGGGGWANQRRVASTQKGRRFRRPSGVETSPFKS
jgi:hypothetical protein